MIDAADCGCALKQALRAVVVICSFFLFLFRNQRRKSRALRTAHYDCASLWGEGFECSLISTSTVLELLSQSFASFTFGARHVDVEDLKATG
jgi:hypothetical protein